MRKIFLFVLILSAFNGYAQKKAKPETYAKTITAADLKKHLYIVAGADMEGRETATPGQKKAAAYIENQFRSLGLQPGNNGSYQQYYDVYQDSLIDAAVEVNGKAFSLEKDFAPFTDNLNTTMRFSRVVVVGSAALDTLKASYLTGQLVMVFANPPNRRFFPAGGIIGNLLQKGVAGVLFVPENYQQATGRLNRKGNQSINNFKVAIAPQMYTISPDIARAILGDDYDNVKANASKIKSYDANVMLDMKKTTVSSQSSNVIAVLPGTDLKDQYLFVTAHYDHLGKRDDVIYYGADDDGSGTTGVLEIAEAFAKAKADGKGPRRTVVFMTVSGEEKGLWGSDYYSSHPIFPLNNTTADLNIDMIGRSDSSRKVGDSTNYVYVVGDDKLSSDLRSISESVNKKYLKMELDYKFNDPHDRNRIYYRSDHYNFAKRGVPIIFYYDGMLGADYHKPTDTPDKINYDLHAKRARLVFYTAWEMANRDEMLKRDIPLDTAVFTR
jgi:hypothetical protein